MIIFNSWTLDLFTCNKVSETRFKQMNYLVEIYFKMEIELICHCFKLLPCFFTYCLLLLDRLALFIRTTGVG